MKYEGKFPELKLVKNTDKVIEDTIGWAKTIAADNDFHYGKGDAAHHNGCYFCGTQPKVKKSLKMYEHTYCCNPFIGAAWAHGGCDKKALSLCSKGKSWGFKKGSGEGNYHGSSRFTNLGHPAKSKLKAGDVLCRDTHVALYIGNGKIVEASGGDDNKKNSSKWNNSIRVKELSDSNYKKFPRVHRYNKSVNRNLAMKHGEYSDRIILLKDYLNWYNESFKLNDTKLFDDATLTAVKKFQKAQKITVTGIVNSTTLKAMKAYCKDEPTPTPKKTYQGELPNTKVVEKSNEAVIAKMESFAKKYAKDNTFKYKKWTNDEKTHQCPICHPELQKVKKYKGWNCIGYVSAIIFHASKDKSITCSCGGLLTDGFAQYDKLTLTTWKKRNGKNWKLVAKQDKKISVDKLEKGDVVLCYSGKTYKHTCWYAGNGYIYDATSSTGISRRKYSELGSVPKIAFRYTGTIDKTRNVLYFGDKGTEIKKLQDFLVWAGFLKEVNEVWDDKTEEAANAFCIKVGLVDSCDTSKVQWGTKCNDAAKTYERD